MFKRSFLLIAGLLIVLSFCFGCTSRATENPPADPYKRAQGYEAKGEYYNAVKYYAEAGILARPDLERAFEKMVRCEECPTICHDCIDQLRGLQTTRLVTHDQALAVYRKLDKSRNPDDLDNWIAGKEVYYQNATRLVPQMHRLTNALALPEAEKWALAYAQVLMDNKRNEYNKRPDLDRSQEWREAYRIMAIYRPAIARAVAESIARSISLSNMQRLVHAEEWMRTAGKADPGAELAEAVRSAAFEHRSNLRCEVAGHFYRWLGDAQNEQLMARCK